MKQKKLLVSTIMCISMIATCFSRVVAKPVYADENIPLIEESRQSEYTAYSKHSPIIDITGKNVIELGSSMKRLRNRYSGIIAGTQSGYLSATDDYILYSLSLTSGTYLQAQLTTPANANIDYDLYLFDSNGNILVGSDNITHLNGNNGTLPETLGYIAGGNDNLYYLGVVSSVGGSISEPYILDYSFSSSYDSYEVDDTLRQALPFTFGNNGTTLNNRTLSSPIDNEWYTLTIPANRNYNSISITTNTNSVNICKTELYQNVASAGYEMSLIGAGSSIPVSTGTYYLRVCNALSMEAYDDLDVQNYSITVAPIIEANKITITSMSGTEGEKYVTYSGYGNHFRTATGTVTVIGYAYIHDNNTGIDTIASNTPVTIRYRNPYWLNNNNMSDAYAYGYGVTDATGKYTIQVYLPQSAGSIMVDTGISYHYFDLCYIAAILTNNPNVYKENQIFHISYSIYHG